MTFTERDLLSAYPKIYAFSVSLTRDRDSACDLAQEAALRMWKCRDTFSGQFKELVSWGIKIAQNWWYDQRDLLRSKIEHSAGDTIFDIPVGMDGAQEHRVDLADAMNFLGTCNGSGEALMLLAMGESHEEIAKIQGIEVGTVKSRAIRMRERLDERFGIERNKRRTANRTGVRKCDKSRYA